MGLRQQFLVIGLCISPQGLFAQDLLGAMELSLGHVIGRSLHSSEENLALNRASDSRYSEAQLLHLGRVFASYLDQELSSKEVLAQKQLACEDPDFSSKLKALHELGQSQTCLNIERRCAGQGSLESQMQALNCAASLWSESDLEPILSGIWGRAGGLASMSRAEVRRLYLRLKMLKEDMGWRSLETRLADLKILLSLDVQANLDALAESVFRPNSSAMGAALEIFIDQEIGNAVDSEYDRVLVEFKIAGRLKRYEYDAVVSLLEGLFKAGVKIHLGSFVRAAYLSLFYQEGNGFKSARPVYTVYARHLQSPEGYLPIEENTFDYSEIYGKICTGSLLSEAERGKWIRRWQKISFGGPEHFELVRDLEALLKKSPKADLLTMRGSLAELSGDLSLALKSYWTAHELCPQLHRANWGLLSVRRVLRAQQTEYFKRMELTFEDWQGKVAVPTGLPYFRNWGQLSPEIQKRVYFATQPWQGFLESLLNPSALGISSGISRRASIKFGFELLSEASSGYYSSLRNQRVGGVGHSRDRRLWDDVRGIGGDMVLADLSEVTLAAHGAYNLLSHEMAHQFHFLLMELEGQGKSLQAPMGTCIERFYQGALARGIMANPYSAFNVLEYFAEGITYFLRPTDSPLSFGINRGWYEQHDPDLLELLDQIDRVKGQLSSLRCPVDV